MVCSPLDPYSLHYLIMQKDIITINAALDRLVFSKNRRRFTFIKAARYATLPEGHRYRGLIALQTYKLLGGRNKSFMKVVVGIECIHHATLIFDDLPAMDHSPIRKGKDSVYKKFGEATSILAGLFLEQEGKRLIRESAEGHNLTAKDVHAILTAVDTSTYTLICGQELDLSPQKKTSKVQQEILETKNDLFRLSATLPALFLKKGTHLKVLESFGKQLSVGYQLLDDLHDNDGVSSLKKLSVATSRVSESLRPLPNSKSLQHLALSMLTYAP